MSSKAQILVVPGYGATAESNWFPWLARETRRRKRSALVFDPPSPMKPNLHEWLNEMRLDANQLSPKPAIIGHSLGCIAAMHAVVKFELSPEKLILVAPPYHPMGISPLLNFFKTAVDYKKISLSTKQIFLLGSEDDWIVPIEHIRLHAKKLKTEPIIFSENGHFMSLEFPEILPLLFD